MKAVWKHAVLADSNETVELEGSHYFPADSVARQYLRQSDRLDTCPRKGTARYYDVVVGNAINPNAARVFRDPNTAADHIRGRVAFSNGVELIA